VVKEMSVLANRSLELLPMTRHRSKTPAVLVVAGTVVAIALFALAWRRAIAPRRERHRTRHRADEHAGSSVTKAPPDHGVDRQGEESGVGDLTHRRYSIEVPRSTFTRQSLIREIQQRVHELSPSALAEFEKTSGHTSYMVVGDEYDVTMLGPWNGRVRVAKVADDSFTLITLDGHPEAGHITFTVEDHVNQPDAFVVSIESWARSRDKTVQVAYDTMSVGRQVQAEVWVTFLQRVAELTGCADAPKVDIDSEDLTT